jgi:hypothetical protein
MTTRFCLRIGWGTNDDATAGERTPSREPPWSWPPRQRQAALVAPPFAPCLYRECGRHRVKAAAGWSYHSAALFGAERFGGLIRVWAHRGRLAAGSTDKAHEFLRGIQLVNRSPEVIGVDRLAANIADILDGHDYEVLPAHRVSEMSQVIAQIADHKYCRPRARPFRLGFPRKVPMFPICPPAAL